MTWSPKHWSPHPRFARYALWLLAVTPLWLSSGAMARPGGPVGFCAVQSAQGLETPLCTGQIPSCQLCHTSTGYTPGWNDFGLAVITELSGQGYYDIAPSDEHFNDSIQDAVVALMASGATDHDGDGVSTVEEIAVGTGPGDSTDYWSTPTPSVGDVNPYYSIGGYDPNVAFLRTSVAFCGESPSFDEREAFRALDLGAQTTAIHQTLEACLQTSYWRDEALMSLADDKIRPIPRFEQWRWDYRLWRYANVAPCDQDDGSCGDALPRSAADLVTGDYHVREHAAGALVREDGRDLGAEPICTVGGNECGLDSTCQCYGQGCPERRCLPLGGFQVLAPEHRAGMLTSSWYLFFYTMFSAMPRTAAAHALRSYFSAPIERQVGLHHQDGEPRDVDNKKVDGVGCRECHMTLDTATYAFARYHGIAGAQSAQYDANRPFSLGLWTPQTEPQAYFYETPVEDLIEFAAVGASRPEFRRSHVLTFFTWTVGRPPRPSEAAEFATLVESMAVDGDQTPALLHRIVDTQAFGGVQ